MTRTKIKETAWSYLKPSETMCVIFGLFVFLAIITVVSMYRSQPEFNARLTYEKLSPAQKKLVDSAAAQIVPLDDDTDKNVRYAERVREASSIGLGLSLFLVSQRVSRNRVMSLPEVIKEFAKSDLLPPGVVVLFPKTAASYGILKAERGIYYINYSPAPLKIEVLAASPNGLSDGAVFVLRVPDTSAANIKPSVDSSKVSSAGAWATIFEAPETENHYIPPPFSPVSVFTAMNWKIRPLQQSEMSPQRVKELNDYLQKQNLI